MYCSIHATTDQNFKQTAAVYLRQWSAVRGAICMISLRVQRQGVYRYMGTRAYVAQERMYIQQCDVNL